MQDRYVGDVGDFGKYGLLRLIARETDLRLAIIWHLFGDESHNSDGRHIGYLRNPDFAKVDPPLHASLTKLVERGKRSVRAVARSSILPRDTLFFAYPVSDREGDAINRQTRAAARIAWLRKALSFSKDRDLVFFDPDNGVETHSVRRHSPKSGKYIFWDELTPFWQRGQSLLIYHHLNRTASVARQSEILKEKFEKHFPDAALLRYFLFRRGSCRHFWLVAQEKHAERFRRVIDSVGQSEWRIFFEIG